MKKRTEVWEHSWRRAVDSLDAAEVLQRRGHLCSATSRAYYAAYQATTAILCYARQLPPVERQGWDHKETPKMLRITQMTFCDQDTRQNLSGRLSALYKLRITADYEMRITLTETASAKALKDASFIVKSVGAVLPLAR